MKSKKGSKKGVKFVKVGVALLKQHYANKKIYNVENLGRLIISLLSIGQLMPIIVNKNYVVLSGWRRLQALILLGRTEIEVALMDIDEEDEVEYIVSSNKRRPKSIMEIYWAIKLLKCQFTKKNIKNDEAFSGNLKMLNCPTREIIAEIIGITVSELTRIEIMVERELRQKRNGNENESDNLIAA
jgi:ParB-like nuclease family protein